MDTTLESIHPGEVLTEQIGAPDITATGAARALSIFQSHLSRILHDRCAFRVDMALPPIPVTCCGDSSKFAESVYGHYRKDRNVNVCALFMKGEPIDHP